MTDASLAAPSFALPSSCLSEQEEGDVLRPRFDASGLITAVVSDADDGSLLMVAHMNAQALDATLSSGIAHYWSRSRGVLWKKGETSGALQMVREIRVDCDQDALWLLVSVAKPQETCHTGRPSCFYRRVRPQERKLEAAGPVASPAS